MTAFTGLPADNPLRAVLPPEQPKPMTVDVNRVTELIKVDKIVIVIIDSLHRELAKERSKKREAEVQRHNRRTNISPVSLEIGDLVLVEDLDVRKGITACAMERSSSHNKRTIFAGIRGGIFDVQKWSSFMPVG